MRIAFYAPLKAPTHPVPSGDRLIGRLIVRALRAGGHAVEVVSTLRAFDRGDAERQARLARLGAATARRVARRLSSTPPDLWLTYHLYHKAPDWLGPPVSRALGIPYVAVEASVAPKQADGPWALGHRAVCEALAGAAAVIAINRVDVPAVAALLGDPSRVHYVPPFMDLAALAPPASVAQARAAIASRLALPVEVPWLVTVAMMRPGNKLDSYRVLAAALGRLTDTAWQMLVVGDGVRRGEVEAAFADAGIADRVHFLGLLDHAAVAAHVGVSDLFVWPAVAEPLGMAMLEAAALGVAVVAGASGGVPDIVRDAETGVLCPPGDVEAFAGAVRALLADPGRRRELGAAAQVRAHARHDLAAGGRALDGILREVVARWR
ncbi:MAG: glycosyltransferase family 4 protein [Chromatiales bacterium]|nr:glycosyltransferase family 4 protein [Chromatiales bacterium]